MPYLSVVVSPGGAETEVFRERWRAQAERHGLSSEVIPAGGAGSRSRNADIRSASGEYLLATTADTVFPDELIEFLASQRLQANRMYRADRYDTSRVWAREGVFPLTPEGLRANAAEDMAPAGSGIHFGSGWFPASRLAGRTGRFLGGDAEVVLARMPQPWAAMDMEVEPGPGVRPPARLQVIDGDEAVAAEWRLERRMAVRFWVPPAAGGGAQRFRLRAPDGGRPTPLDLHIFNFRCLLAGWTAPRPLVLQPPLKELVRDKRPTLRRLAATPWLLPRAMKLLGAVGTDVFGTGIEYWGEGWWYREQAAGETFRWAAEDAELVVRPGAESGNLAMLAEPGPGVGGGSCVLRVRLPDGTVLGRAEVQGTSVVNIRLPKFAEPVARLFVGPEGGAKAVAGDARVLGFRVFACTCEAAAGAGPPETVAQPGGWISVTRGVEPVTVDWTEKLLGCQDLIEGMGKPDDLHLHGCGNFTLMARSHWLDLRGFPELDLPAADSDALLCLAAHHAGVREEVLPYRVGGAASEPPRDPGANLLWIGTQMRRLGAPAIFNLDDWGAER
ncbi:MAG TPA: hypothetical protein VKF41_09670 [Bryobacteraceae bacterium]|nr:hypothetical protein [Bryobacteraceae bacterium]